MKLHFKPSKERQKWLHSGPKSSGYKSALKKIANRSKHQERIGYNDNCVKCIAERALS